MSYFTLLFVFSFGLIIGSFLNCLTYRLSLPDFSFREGLKGRSFCPHCRHSLSWLDLIPLVSFALLKGKCRYCGGRISWQYPLGEALAGLLFVLIFQKYFSEITPFLSLLNVFYYWTMASFLLIIFFFDLKHQLIPNIIIYLAIGLAAVRLFFLAWNFGQWDLEIIISAGWGILPSFFLLAINLFSRGRWMGLGDFNLALLMGLILGWPGIIFAFVLAFYSGALAGLAMVIAGMKKMKSEMPFAPFLVAGTWAVILWESRLASWYERLFLLE